jgi:hypothetical protein
MFKGKNRRSYSSVICSSSFPSCFFSGGLLSLFSGMARGGRPPALAFRWSQVWISIAYIGTVFN